MSTVLAIVLSGFAVLAAYLRVRAVVIRDDLASVQHFTCDCRPSASYYGKQPQISPRLLLRKFPFWGFWNGSSNIRYSCLQCGRMVTHLQITSPLYVSQFGPPSI